MDNLQDNYKEMKVLIDADLKSDVDEAFGLTDEFEKLQKLIPEDLTVTFEEAQNLIAQGYAGILENAKETSENSIKLDKETMNAAIDMAESGHLVIGTLHTKSCAETVDRMINFYEISDQSSVKYLISALLKLN